MITLKNENVEGIINLPTSVSELTPEVFEKLTKNVVLQKHYVIVALCWKLTLAEILMTNKRNGDAKVITMIAKTNVAEEHSWIKQGNIAIINRSSIELGTHLHINTAASVANINNYFNKVANIENKKAIPMSVIANLPKEKIYLIEFKILPASDIKAVLDINSSNEDPFA